MICHACRERHHDQCRGSTWCACQHQAAPATPEQKRAADEQNPPETEPPVNRVRQG